MFLWGSLELLLRMFLFYERSGKPQSENHSLDSVLV